MENGFLALSVRITKRPAAIAEVELISKDKEGEGLYMSLLQEWPGNYYRSSGE